MIEIDLSLVQEQIRETAKEGYDTGNAGRLMVTVSSGAGLAFVCDNILALQSKGIYEASLAYAYFGVRTNWAKWQLSVLECLFAMADRQRLRAAGDPLPSGESFTLYRGVAGKKPYRKAAGVSWTRDLDKAIWFAKRHKSDNLFDPAVYQTKARAVDIWLYSNGRREDDFVYRARHFKRIASIK